MAGYRKLTIYRLARENLRDVASFTGQGRGFGDLSNQMRRATLSAVSNIAEGGATGCDRTFVRYLRIALGSVHELHAQVEVAVDLGLLGPRHPLHDRSDHLGRCINRLIAYLTR